MQIVVLRYGHRDVRDYRVTTHCCLVSRALGAEKIIVEGEEDKSIRESVEGVNKNWGSKFKIEFANSWRKAVKEYKRKGFFVVHLTMYGLLLQKEEKKLRKKKKLLIIIGSQKVTGEVYRQADANIAVTSQPHSEIAALAVALDRIQAGKELDKKFSGAKIRIVPCGKGKKIVKNQK